VRIYILPAGEPVPGLYRTRELIYTYTYTIQSVKYKIHTNFRESGPSAAMAAAQPWRSPNILVFREGAQRGRVLYL
jgi:hypothetical protein